MNKRSRFRLLPIYHAIALIALAPSCYASQNFLIEPNGSIPTSLPSGGSALANFTITNLTNSARNGYTVQGLPGTVTQITSAGNCSSPINLASKASCNLQLNITGAVDGYFAICKGSSCTTSSVPLSVTVSHFIPVFASGTYNDNSFNFFPLLLQDLSGTLNYPPTIISNLPTNPTYVQPDLYAVSCSGSLCISAGYDDNGNVDPLVAFSTDSGNTWTYPIGSVGSYPTDYTPGTGGQFVSASCSGTLCIAGGTYTDNNSAFPYPLIAQYKNGTWTYPISALNNPPNGFDLHGIFSSVSCSSSICIAAGNYADSESKTYPVLAESIDGNNWIYKLDITTPPNNYNYVGAFLGGSCYNDMCIAGGTYEDGNGTFYPLLAQTTDGGANWSYVIDDTNSPLDVVQNGFVNDQFNSTSCSASICIGAGTYFSNSATAYLGLIAQTVDQGALYTYPVSTLQDQPSDFASNAGFTNASCSGTVCVAAGSYTNTGGNQVAMLIQTTDGGTSWQYKIDSTNQAPGYTSAAQFNTTSCQDNTCIAAGFYHVGQEQSPMLAASTNGGAWTYIVYNTVGLPANFNNTGAFNGSDTPSPSLVRNYMKEHYFKKDYTYQSLLKGHR